MALGRRKIEFLLEAKDRTARAFGTVKKNLSGLAASAAKLARSIGGSLGLFSGAAGAGALAAIKKLADELDNLGKKADALGIDAEELSKLGYAAEISGSSLTEVINALEKMQNRVSKAAEGTGEAKDAIIELGLEAAELKKLKPEEMFKLLADAISNVGIQADRVRLKRAIFGRGDPNLLNLINLTSVGINRLGQEVEGIGGVVTGADTKAAAEFADSMLRLSTNIDALGRSAGGPAISSINKLFEVFGLDAGIDAVNADIAQLRNEIERTGRLLEGSGDGILEGLAGMFTPDSVLRERIERYKVRLDELLKTKEDWAKKDAELEKRQESIAAAAAHNAKMAATRKNEVDALKEANKAKEDELKRHEAALEASLARQVALQEAVADATEEFTDYGKEPDVPDRADTVGGVAAVWDNINAGDTDGARAALEALIEMFRAYQESGKASKADVITMVAQLEALANATNQLEAKGLEKRTKRAKEEAEALKDEMQKNPAFAKIEAADGSGKAVMIGTQKQIDQEAPARVKVVLDLQSGATEYYGTQPTSDRNPQNGVQMESLKRGFRL